MPNKFFLFAGEHKIAEGKGLVMPSDKPGVTNNKPWGDANADPMQQMQNALDDFRLREKMTVPEVPFPKEIPELSFRVKISKRRMRRLRQMAIGKRPRLPRKLKKAARHLNLDEYYPRTKWVQRLIHRWLREINQMHKRFVKRAMFEQYIDQHPGMLTYDPAPLTPSPEAADMLRRGDVTMNFYYPHAQEMVLDRKQITNLSNIINNKEE